MVKYIQNYALYESIGSGVYGKVYRAINNNDKKQYAVKVIPIAKFRQNKKLQECTVNQINILTNIQNNQHIIRYYDMLKTSNNFYFIYEYCNGGTLEGLLSKQGKLSQQSAMLIFKQLLDAFQVLNKYNIMHRDMKPDNIFFNNGIIKLGDFGFCKNLNSADQMTRTMLGSPIYMAPEVLRGQIYSNKADIWSLGVVLYQMIFGHCPFQSNSIAKLIQVLNTKQLDFPGTISQFLKNLIKKMLTKDSSQRIGWMQLFTLKIDNQGSIQNQKVPQSISSLMDATKTTQVNSLTSTKYTPPTKKQTPPLQTNTSNPSINQPKSQLSPPSSHQYQSPQSLGQSSFKKPRNSGHNAPTTSTNQSNGVSGFQSNGNNPSVGKQTQPKICQDHKVVLEGIKLSMQVVDSRIPNYSGFTNLILTKNISILENLIQKPFRKEILQILQKELRQMKFEKQAISSKMFAYQLKGLQDWKKYMRGKFFQDQKTVAIWYKMISFLSSKGNEKTNMNLSRSQMAQSIKNILY